MILTIDIGTSNFKSALWDFFGTQISFVSIPLSINIEGEKHEADPSIWLHAFEECREKLFTSSINIKNVEAIVISGNGPSLVPVTGEPEVRNGLFVPSYKARLWLDRRAEKYQDEVKDVMGGFVDASFFLPKILYLKNEEKEIYEETITFIGCPEYLAYALTGSAKTVFPSEGFDRWFWNDNVLRKLNLDASKFPEFINPEEMFGKLSKYAAELFGFKEDIPVISGGPDFYAAIIGSGVTEPGQALDRTGSSEGINLCTNKLINIDNFMSYRHPVKPYWNLSAKISRSGIAIKNECEKLGVSGFNEFISLAEKNIEEKEKAARLTLETLCLQIKEIIIKMEYENITVNELRVTGGLSACDLLNQIKANVTGKKIIKLKYKDAELLGCAIIGCCYLGKFSSYSDASKNFVKIEKQFEPEV